MLILYLSIINQISNFKLYTIYIYYIMYIGLDPAKATETWTGCVFIQGTALSQKYGPKKKVRPCCFLAFPSILSLITIRSISTNNAQRKHASQRSFPFISPQVIKHPTAKAVQTTIPSSPSCLHLPLPWPAGNRSRPDLPNDPSASSRSLFWRPATVGPPNLPVSALTGLLG